ncbi:hypothetical protein BH18ACT15_BH18ACT15_12740 [soil metagenome]
MRRKIAALPAAFVLLAGLTLGGPASAGAAASSQPGIGAVTSPTLSSTRRLPARRYVAAGTRAYDIGDESGRYPAMGFHTTGEMGGLWTPPLKLLDGIWFGIDDQWIGRATRFTSGWGYVTMDLPTTDGVRLSRTDFSPDGHRAVVIGLHLRSPADRTVTLSVDAHSELMSAYPWATTTPSQSEFNLRDRAAFKDGALRFSERGQPPVANASPHDWAAFVGSRRTPVRHATGQGFWGPQAPVSTCPAPEDTQPYRCDDSIYGEGAGGRLDYRLDLKAGKTKTVWFAVAGSDKNRASARRALTSALDRPEAQLGAKVAQRKRLAERTKVRLSGDSLLAQSIEWSKQNLADLRQTASDLQLRKTSTGTEYPPSEGTLRRARFVGAGFPDYPWLFGTDVEYTSFANVAAGQFGPAKDGLRALRDVSEIVNDGSGKVVHEVVTDGSVYFGANADPGNTDETVKFPSAVALVWRWTGDNAFLKEMYPFARSNMRYVFRTLDADGDGWLEGFGNVEREGMGEEKLDVTVYAIRGLRDLAAMARARHDTETSTWATRRARGLERRFEATWWMPRVPQHADSLDDPGNVKLQQRHWIGATPMEVEIYRGLRAIAGLTTRAHGSAALRLRETRCYSDAFGLYHTGDSGCDPVVSEVPAEKVIFTLNTAIMAVGEGNYGRLSQGGQRRFTAANRRLMLPTPDEQPGAMPEIAPSPDYGRSIDLPFNSRAQVMQAWGNYGTLWPVVHQQLGVTPDLGRGRLEVVPQVPPYEHRISGRNIRLAGGHIDVSAESRPRLYATDVKQVVRAQLSIGHVVPRHERVVAVQLNGHEVTYEVRRSHRGKEVVVRASGGGRQHLVVATAG